MGLFSEGNANMRDLLGGKGAGVAEMTNAGLAVPPGFTITTEACNAHHWGQLLRTMDSYNFRQAFSIREIDVVEKAAP